MNKRKRVIESGCLRDMIVAMLSYTLYFLIVVALSVLLTTAFRRLREDGRVASPQEDEDFDRRIAEIEKRFGQRGQTAPPGSEDNTPTKTGEEPGKPPRD